MTNIHSASFSSRIALAPKRTATRRTTVKHPSHNAVSVAPQTMAESAVEGADSNRVLFRYSIVKMVIWYARVRLKTAGIVKNESKPRCNIEKMKTRLDMKSEAHVKRKSGGPHERIDIVLKEVFLSERVQTSSVPPPHAFKQYPYTES